MFLHDQHFVEQCVGKLNCPDCPRRPQQLENAGRSLAIWYRKLKFWLTNWAPRMWGVHTRSFVLWRLQNQSTVWSGHTYSQQNMYSVISQTTVATIIPVCIRCPLEKPLSAVWTVPFWRYRSLMLWVEARLIFIKVLDCFVNHKHLTCRSVQLLISRIEDQAFLLVYCEVTC